MRSLRRFARIATRVYREVQRARSGSRDGRPASSPESSRRNGPVPPGADGGSWRDGGYPGDYTGPLTPAYSPSPDGLPDPGEIVWAWVPYEEDFGQGKDRPVLLVGHDGAYLLGLMLTSRDRNNARAHDADYVDIGAGPWDPRGRESEVKLDRVIRLLPQGIRREGAVLPRRHFERVTDGLIR
ncbi:type II toxin-antitoxin system PemK/MazF family toxin [Zhihengliuella sp.]|uniref:type II toxin-antitoxin system PemK/MazF family toxin n=1 Tax=Zhihengliuella sp. TaxID=1954483 RepID=UPI0028117212|nr:type II toxin-antitoxin system PemK/MazF family toxin [Zhihengliuella sp.]